MTTELERAISLPNSTWGYLEWATGILRINATEPEISHLETLPNYERIIYDETITHESFHHIQICTTGYLFRYALRLLKEIFPLIEPYLRIVTTTHEGYLDHQKIWEPFNHQPLPITSGLEKILRTIDEPGDDGITVRDIVESSAFLAQKQVHTATLDHKMHLQILDFVPGPEYSAAFLLAESILGDLTFDLFHLIVYTSLCFEKPHQVLVPLCHKFKLLGVTGYDEQAKPKILKILSEVEQKHQWLGTPHELVFEKKYPVHPFYADSIYRITKFLSQDLHTGYAEFMGYPERWLGEFRKGLSLNLLVNPDEYIMISSETSIGYTKIEEPKISTLLLTLTSAYSILIMKRHMLGFRYLELRQQ